MTTLIIVQNEIALVPIMTKGKDIKLTNGSKISKKLKIIITVTLTVMKIRRWYKDLCTKMAS